MLKVSQTLVAVGGAVVMALSGCQGDSNPFARARNTPPEPLNAEPLMVDEAMQLRDWNRVTALYASGDTAAGATGFPFTTRQDQPEWRYAALETPLFVFQAIALPVNLIIAGPTREIHYAGATIEPTHTAMPPLPPSDAVVLPQTLAPENMPTTAQ
jgi:hypothetical protein